MEKKAIIQILVEREGYSVNSALVASHEALSLTEELKAFYEAWLNDASKQSDYQSNGISLLDLKEKTGSTYLAALLNMDWIIKEPEVAIPAIESTMNGKHLKV